MTNYFKAITITSIALASALVASSAARAYDSENQSAGTYFAQEKRIRYAALVDLSRPARQTRTSSTRTLVADPTGKPAGAITIVTKDKVLYLSLGGGKAMRYLIGVGRPGFKWAGQVRIARKAEWPAWTPPPEMLKRRPDLPRLMKGGIDNPLGARALYLYKGNRDSMFRIHGTSEPETIGGEVSSGCIRMLNTDVTDLYNRVRIGTQVSVL